MVRAGLAGHKRRAGPHFSSSSASALPARICDQHGTAKKASSRQAVGSGAVTRILDVFRRDPGGLIEHLYGAPKSHRGKVSRFPGTVSLIVSGPERGLWSRWSADVHGYAHSYKLEPIRFALGCDAVEAWEWAARYTGIVRPDAEPETPGERRERQRRNSQFHLSTVARTNHPEHRHHHY